MNLDSPHNEGPSRRGQTRTNGIGDLQITAFLSPAKPGSWSWGVGAISQLPTHSNQLLGSMARRPQ
jgi:hypothetical protein